MKENDYQKYLRETKEFYDVKFGETPDIQLNDDDHLRWAEISKSLGSLRIEQQGSNRKIAILDFGCGDGRFSKLLNQYGDVTGVDISEKAIEKAKKNVPECQFYVADLSSAKISHQWDQTFDVIVSTEVLEHIYDQPMYCKNVKALLKDHGVFILTTPNGKCYRHYFGNGPRTFGQTFEWWLTSGKIEEILTKTNLKVIRKQSFYNDWIFKRRARSWLWVFGNRHVRYLLNLFGLSQIAEKFIQQLEMGLYLLIVATTDDHES